MSQLVIEELYLKVKKICRIKKCPVNIQDDVCQEAVLSIWKNRDTFNSLNSYAQNSYLDTTVVRNIIDLHRDTQLQNKVKQSYRIQYLPSLFFEEEEDIADRSLIVERLLSLLNAQEQAPLRFYLEGGSFVEGARLMDVETSWFFRRCKKSIKSIKRRLNHAKKEGSKSKTFNRTRSSSKKVVSSRLRT